MDQDSLVVRSSHCIPILEATIYPATALSIISWRRKKTTEQRTENVIPWIQKLSPFLLSLGRLPSLFFSVLAHCWKEQKIRIKGGLLSKWELSLGITLKELNVFCFEMILISSYGSDIPITSGLILDVKSLIKQWDEITILLHINYFIRILNPHWWKYIR